MKLLVLATLSFTCLQVMAQQTAPQASAPAPGAPRPATADPYFNAADPSKLSFPLAAPAGKDSGALQTAPKGAVNTGPFDEKSWKYGPNYDAGVGGKIWNPVRLKMLQGEKVSGGTLFSATDPETYCAMAAS